YCSLLLYLRAMGGFWVHGMKLLTFYQLHANILSMPEDINKITEEMLSGLDARSKDIVVRRFGLKDEKPETLESIGKEYGITRERVRQIESNAKKALSGLETLYRPIYNLLTDVFAEHGGVLAEEHAVELTRERTGQSYSSNLVHFHLDVLPHFKHATREKLFDSHWRHEQHIHERIEDIVIIARDILKKHNHPIPLDDLIAEIQSHLLEAHHLEVGREPIYAALVASKHIAPTAFNEWGLIGWAETSPRGVGDKAYAVLRRHGKPTHFRDITAMINEASFDAKQANPQTVHNELIKDSRFVLVGRGLYGLKEWGYVSGTVADVLESVLRTALTPMTREELIDEVLKQRLVKKNTILLSLQNNKRFKKTGENRYTLQQVA
ncbi:MAG: HTH domain-containing protein, partial [Candidatus Andersenbacteria bacterium]